MSNQLDDHLIDESEESAQPIQYRSLSVLAILGMAAAVFSFLTIFHWLFWLIPLTAIFLGYRAVKQIRHAPTEYTGLIFARSAMTIACVLGFIGAEVRDYLQKNTVPYGYKLIEWEKDLQPDPKKPAEIIPESAYKLEPSDDDRERRVYIAGYMYPGRQMVNIKEFVLVPSVSHCNFCQQQLKSTEMIYVKISEDMKPLEYTQNLVKVGGKFKIDRNQAANPFGGLPYQLEADFVPE
jgi:hypothetical protein